VELNWTEVQFWTRVFAMKVFTLQVAELTCIKLTQLHDALLVTRVSVTKLIGCSWRTRVQSSSFYLLWTRLFGSERMTLNFQIAHQNLLMRMLFKQRGCSTSPYYHLILTLTLIPPSYCILYCNYHSEHWCILTIFFNRQYTCMSTVEHSNSRFESIRFVMRIYSNRFVL